MTLLHEHPQRFLQRIVCIVVLCICSNVMAQEKKGLSEEEQLDRMLQHHNERYMPGGLGFSAGYATPDVLDFSIFHFMELFQSILRKGTESILDMTRSI